MTTNEPIRTEVAELWDDLQQAKRRGDVVRVRTLENRLRDLQGAVRFAGLSDAQLDARIASLDGNRAPVGLLAYSPGGNEGMDAGIADLPRLNRAIAAQQHVGIEEQRTLLLDERERRQALRVDAGGDDQAAPPRGLRGMWNRFVSWLRPSSERALANTRAREAARDGRAAGAVEHGNHHGGGHHGQFPTGGF